MWREVLQKRVNQIGFHQQYKAIKKIGVGKFTSVYLSEKIENQQLYAVKAFPKKRIYKQEENGKVFFIKKILIYYFKQKELLINEIELLRNLDHQNILHLYEVFVTDNSLYMVLELLQGGSLYQQIKSKHKYQNEEIKYMIRGLLEGVAHMHSKNIMHRDLKPENIMFRCKNQLDLVIGDLGLGTKQNIDKYLYVRCGTPGFVAPEVINITDFNIKYDVACDIFSLGVIFHILFSFLIFLYLLQQLQLIIQRLTGKSPFPGKNYEDILNQNREANIIYQGKEYLKLSLYGFQKKLINLQISIFFQIKKAYDLLKKMLEVNPKLRITAKKALQHEYFNDKQNPSVHEIQIFDQDSPRHSPQILVTKGQNMVIDAQGLFKVRTNEKYKETFYSPSIGKDRKKLQYTKSLQLEDNNEEIYDAYCQKKSNVIMKNLKNIDF
ncbi:protein kinase domain protein [Ichthyophthirius multifiliis]|uniref:Protein kinase domain protein n=1 Tax=Ichthyophthirius multifiliis TaxID=5932 RepID=G0QZ92_ICHMU|nr:protein kinase domain protein [Ichthyophthirius multifiliis]EGR29475.1 protein kinase domain protein [Ichthyophthirius multifiliis]|eukprot:XP_004030711.1 protein kinase domain protein [Ichthyophthirius multifiliis]